MKRKPDARTFGQDLARGEHDFRPGQPGSLPAGAGANDGVLMQSDTARDQHFYAKKRAAERAVGRVLTIDEFRRDHYVPDDAATAMGTSIFDPVLCELAYRWFCPPNGAVLDPFAGGSVRGIVAGMLGRQYVGVDLSERQVVANRVQAELIFEGRPGPKPLWVAGDSADVLHPDGFSPLGFADLKDGVDFVFSCPPYADLEIYSDDPRDLSTMAYDAFLVAYREIIRLACARLRDDRFACFVVGDVRDPAGLYRSLPQATIEAFAAAGLALYNDAILVTAAGSLPIRARRQFEASRKLGTTHQRVLVFVKGDPRRATEAVGACEFGDPFEGEAPDEEGAATGPPQSMVVDRLREETAPTLQTWKLSAKSLVTPWECTLRGIRSRCGGNCCTSVGGAFWPGKSGGDSCPMLGPDGCTFAPEDKPVTCLLYPLKLNEHGTAVIHFRAGLPNGVCKGNG